MDKTRLLWLSGYRIKQGDTSSIFKLKLKTEEGHELNGSALLQLIDGSRAKFEMQVEVEKNIISFRLDRVLPVGIYVVEVEHAGYVFPSSNSVSLIVTENMGDVVSHEIVELMDLRNYVNQLIKQKQEETLDVDALIQRLNIHPYDDRELREQVARLSERADQDTGYDDRELRGRVALLESRTDTDTVYDDSVLRRELEALKGRLSDYVYDDSELRGRIGVLESKAPPPQGPQVTSVRHAPTGYAVSELQSDRKGEYYDIYFDNGCILRLRKDLGIPIQETGGVLGIGQPHALEAKSNQLEVAPLTYSIMRTATRSVQTNTWKSANNIAQWYRDGFEIVNPVNNPSDFDWTAAKYNANDTSPLSLANQPYLIRTFYALGIWGASTVEEFGAVRR